MTEFEWQELSSIENNSAYHFISLVELRVAHGTLLKRNQESGDEPEFFAHVKEFINAGRTLGTLLDNTNDRWAAQSLLDYWATALLWGNVEISDASLAEFDISLAPHIDSNLCPFRGLDAFREEDRGLFFGRQRLVNDLTDLLKNSRILFVLGSSGSGKSSLVRAGLIPHLKNGGLPGSENWLYIEPILPGSNPLENLAQSIHPRKSGQEKWIDNQVKVFQKDSNHLCNLITEFGLNVPVVIVVDQFEEIFTLCLNDDERQAFINNLLALIKVKEHGHTVILTMRTDFSNRISQAPTLQPLFDKNFKLLTPLHPSELREAIEEPAKLINLRFEESVVSKLVKDVQGYDAALPLLQFALLKLWDNRERNRITLKAYKHIGGAHLALENSAEELYQKLIPEDQDAARYILLRLSRPAELGDEVTSNRVQRKTLYFSGRAFDRIDRVLERLVDARLVRITEGDSEDDAQVEVAHEALVRNWSRLREWLADERETLRRRVSLTAAAEKWEASGRQHGELWRKGSSFLEARKYKDLDELESEFLATSEKAIQLDIEQKNELERTRLIAEHAEELKTAHDEALRQKVIAQRQARLSSSRELAAAAINNLDVDPERSILLALYGVSVTHSMNEPITAEAEDALHRAIQASRVRKTLAGHIDQVRSLAYGPNGSQIATASEDGSVKIWNATTGHLLLNLWDNPEGVLTIAYNRDGTHLASGGRDKRVTIWNIESRQQEVILVGHGSSVNSVVFDPYGDRLASAGCDNTVRVWDINSGAEVFKITDHEEPINKVVFSPGGDYLATAGEDGLLGIWDSYTGDSIHKTYRRTKFIDVAFDSEAKYLAASCKDGWVGVWEFKELKSRRRGKKRAIFHLVGHNSWVERIIFSPAGDRLATGSKDGTAIVWNFPNPKPLITLSGHTENVVDVAFNPKGEYLATGSWDGLVKLWDISSSQGVFTLPEQEKGFTDVDFSPDGRSLATANYDHTAKIWDSETGDLLRSFLGHTGEVIDVDFSPDGVVLATASFDKTAKIWDISSGNLIHSLSGHDDRVVDLEFSPDGKYLATASFDKTAKVWSTILGKEVFTLLNDYPVFTVTFDPRSELLVTGCLDKKITGWEVSSGKKLFTLEGHTGRIRSLSFSPDGKYLASSSEDKTVKVWDITRPEAPYILALSGHTEEITEVAFSPDGKKLATASADKTAKIWEATTGQERLTLFGQDCRIMGLALSPNSRRLATASEDGTVRVYTLDIERLMKLARKRVTRSLTPEECKKYHIEDFSSPTSFGNSSVVTFWLRVRGTTLAKGGDIEGAINFFEQAKEIDKTLSIDPIREAIRLSTKSMDL